MQLMAIYTKHKTSFQIIGIIFLAIILRLFLFPIKLNDYIVFLAKWWETIQNNGGILALKNQIGDYTPPYIFLLSLGTYLTKNSLMYIKLLSCILDFALAFFLYFLVKKHSKRKAILAFSLVLFSPAVFINSSLCAQCDVIFTLFIIIFTYFICSDKKRLALVCYGIALSFKLQAIFVAPIFLYLLLTRKIKIYDLIYCCIGFIIFNIPSLLLGRNILEIIAIYLFQTTEYPGITRSAPNLYSLFNLHYVEIAPWIKYSLTILTIALSVLIVIHKKKKQQKYTNNDFVIKMTLLSLLVPFFLPGMMDRYFYLANIFVILILSLFNYNDKKVFLLSGISFLAYSLPTIAIQCIGFGDLHQILLYVATIGNIYIIYSTLKTALH